MKFQWGAVAPVSVVCLMMVGMSSLARAEGSGAGYGSSKDSEQPGSMAQEQGMSSEPSSARVAPGMGEKEIKADATTMTLAPHAIAVETAIRHGERLTSHHAGSRTDGRPTSAGVGALLKWTLIETARQEGRIADLGGADVVGHRQVPQPGDKMYGLYDHKRSFGAEWVEMSGAHRIVLDPPRYALRSALRTALRLGR